MGSLEYRVDHAKRLREMRDKLYPLNRSLPSLLDLELETDGPDKEKLAEKVQGLKTVFEKTIVMVLCYNLVLQEIYYEK